jgi:hypothetical protein
MYRAHEPAKVAAAEVRAIGSQDAADFILHPGEIARKSSTDDTSP